MKHLSYLFISLLLLAAQPIAAQNEAKTLTSPEVTATPSSWFSWFKSLRTPNREDARRAQAYVNSKWRCLRHGENCSKKERAALSLLAAATAALIGKGIHSFVTQTPETGSIKNMISVSDIKRIARPENWNRWKNYRGDFITFSDWADFGPSGGGIRATHGIEASGPSFLTSAEGAEFAEHDKYDKIYAYEFRNDAFVATYMIKNKRSKAYIKAQVGYPTRAQAEKFIQDMDSYVLKKLGFNSQYEIAKSVDQRLFL